jgi:2Fe-2S ferredoxin
VPDRVRVEPAGIEFDAQPGETLMEAAGRNGYQWPTVCNGMGSCGVCLCSLLSPPDGLSPPTRFETEGLTVMAGGHPLAGTSLRLACQARVQADVVVLKYGVRPATQSAEEQR